MLSFVCKFCLLEMESGRSLLNKSSPLAFCVLIYGILSTTLGMGDWISDGDNDDLLLGNCISDSDNDDLLFSNCISDGDNDDSLAAFSRDCSSTGTAKRLLAWTLQAVLSFFPSDLRLRHWHFAEGPVTKSLLPLSLRLVSSPCRTAGHPCRHR